MRPILGVTLASSGLWRSLVARLTGGQEVGSSSLPSPTITNTRGCGGFVSFHTGSVSLVQPDRRLFAAYECRQSLRRLPLHPR